LAYPKDRVLLSLAPLAMRMAGPREAVWHAIIRRNYGANHFIVGRDHASPGTDAKGRPFYDAYAAQNLACELSSEIGVNMIPFRELAYLPDEQRYAEAANVPAGRKFYSLSGTRLREDISRNGGDIPEWLVRRQVAEILIESHQPRTRQGVCLWFTGLSGAGKSTTAEIVTTMLLEEGRQVTLLDGDVVRTNLSKGLGFSKEDRDINIRRIGFVAAEVVRHGGIAICAAVSPYRDGRSEVRSMFNAEQFIEVFVDTPLDVCEARDAKGMYAKARRGEIENFTGINDVYEEPQSAEISLETVNKTARENAQLVIDRLRVKGFLKQQTQAANGFCLNGG
jgi:sulfate adenylyltransferase